MDNEVSRAMVNTIARLAVEREVLQERLEQVQARVESLEREVESRGATIADLLQRLGEMSGPDADSAANPIAV